jgi:putative solute:sodium symporter small subunit
LFYSTKKTSIGAFFWGLNLSHYRYGAFLKPIGRLKMSKQTQHWEKTRNLLWITLAIWFVFSIGIFFFGAEMEASSFRPFGYPLSYYMTCQGSLGIFVILIFWFAGRQEKIDEEFGFSEREDD